MKATIEHHAGPGTPKARPQPDGALFLTRLEQRIIKGDDPAGTVVLLKKESLWNRLGTDDRLRWAQLAQMAGEMRTALRVLQAVNLEDPACAAGWRQHLDLLAVLGRRQALAAVLARARPRIGESDYRDRVADLDGMTRREPAFNQAADDPFDRYHQRMAALKRFMSCFCGRRDCFARQWADRKTGRQGYVPVRRPLSTADIEEHLKGRMTYGIYLLRSDGRINCAVIDADLKKELRVQGAGAADRSTIRKEAAHLISRIKELCRPAAIEPLVEFSGAKGYHFWFFFDAPEAPGPVRDALGRLCGQIENMVHFLLLRARQYENDTLRNSAAALKMLASRVEKAGTLDQIRGFEGAASRGYFQCFGHLIRNDRFAFNGRNRRPPLDPVNALLSFVYTLLTNEVLSAIKAVGLDPYMGALHEISYGRPSLACDLVEEYRVFLGDRMVLGLINRKALSPDDFIYRNTQQQVYADEAELRQRRPVEMRPPIARTFIAAYEQMMNRHVAWGADRKKTSYRMGMIQQVRNFANYLMNREERYSPFIWNI